jgi:hypothetical protein
MMDKHKIKDFQIRGNYRNYNLLTYFLKQKGQEDVSHLPKGYIPSEVEYWEEGNENSKVITTGFDETHYLSQPNVTNAREYLSQLISAREGDTEALKSVKKCSEMYYKEKEEYCSGLVFTENEYIVPSISTSEYDDYSISQKGAMLLNLAQEGYPVPDFCILTAKSYTLSDDERKPLIMEAIANLEQMTAQKLGSYEQPLVFAMRCAMPMQIPGLMPTYLNIGVTLKSYKALKDIYGNLVACKIYLNNLKTMFNLLSMHLSETEIRPFYSLPETTTEEIDNKIKVLYENISKKDERLLWDPYYQVNFFISGARNFYEVNKDLLYTFIKSKAAFPSLILQKMVWTVRSDDSYPGVVYSRHSRTGLGTQIESVRSIFGEEIMTGNITAEDNEYFSRNEIKYKFPAIYHFDPLLSELEKKLKSPVTVEFGVESASKSSLFAILQLNPAELTGRATLLSAVDLYKKGIISKERVVELVRPYHLRQIFSERIDDRSFRDLEFFCHGVSVLPRTAVTARAYFSAATALEAKKRGDKVCFCKENFSPTDTIVMSEMDAIICINPIAIHVVTACRGFGIPALIDLQNHNVRFDSNTLVNFSGKMIKEGDYVTISSKNRALLLGVAKFTAAKFQNYMQGHVTELDEKEEKVFRNMSAAYRVYQEIVNTIDQSKIVKITDLAKIIRNDLKDDPGKAKGFLNQWYDTHSENYIEQILSSELGSHQEQHTLYTLLTLERKIDFFRRVIRKCIRHKLTGFNAGAFMLGRFLCLPHPVAFWRALTPDEMAFLLNEFIFFEKYIMVLNEVGERNLNTARKKILTDGLGNITLSPASIEIFIPLKLAINAFQPKGSESSKTWDDIQKHLPPENANETGYLLYILRHKPYCYFFDFRKAWSLSKLKDICQIEKIPVPGEDDI